MVRTPINLVQGLIRQGLIKDPSLISTHQLSPHTTNTHTHTHTHTPTQTTESLTHTLNIAKRDESASLMYTTDAIGHQISIQWNDSILILSFISIHKKLKVIPFPKLCLDGQEASQSSSDVTTEPPGACLCGLQPLGYH